MAATGEHRPGLPSAENLLGGELSAASPQLLPLRDPRSILPQPHSRALFPSMTEHGERMGWRAIELGHSAWQGTSLMGSLLWAPQRPDQVFLRAALHLRLFPPHPPSFFLSFLRNQTHIAVSPPTLAPSPLIDQPPETPMHLLPVPCTTFPIPPRGLGSSLQSLLTGTEQTGAFWSLCSCK